MKTLATVLIVFGLSVNIFSQDRTSKFSFGFHFTPQVSNILHIYPSGYDESYSYMQYDHSKMSFTTGSFLRLQIADNFSLQLGISLSNKGFAGDDPLHWADSARDYFISEIGKYPEHLFYRGNHYYIDIPFSLRYAFHKRNNLTYYVRIGVMTNHYIFAHGFQKTTYNDESEDIDYAHHDYQYLKNNYKLFNVSGLVALGAEYTLSKRINLILHRGDCTYWLLVFKLLIQNDI